MNPTQAPRPHSFQDYQDISWINSAYRSLLSAVVATSAIAAPLAVMQTITSWRLGYLLPMAFAAALEGVYSTLQLGRPRWRDRRGLAFRLGEIALWLVLARAAVWVFATGWPGLVELARWLRDPILFFDGQFVVTGALFLLAWGLSIGLTGDFLDLALRPDEVAAHDSHEWGDSRSQLRVYYPVSRGAIVNSLAARWIWGGLLVVFCAAVSRVEISTGPRFTQIGLSQLGLPWEILAALLCYFVAGLLLMSQARLAVLRSQWYNGDLQVPPTLLRRWPLNSLLTVLLVAMIAALLPIGSTGWLATALETVLAFLMRVAYLVLTVLTFLFTLLLYPLSFLFRQPGAQAPPPPPRMEIPTQQQAVSRLPDWLGGALLWVVLVLIVGYFLLNYLSAHGLLSGRWREWLQQLRFWWRARWAGLRARAHTAAVTLRKRLQSARLARLEVLGGRHIRLSALAPAERVRYFYLRAIGRAADRGLTRPLHKTPLEFVPDLVSEWPEADVDVKALTDAFVAARYDRRPIVADEARNVQGVFRRVMAALRGKADSTADGRKADRAPGVEKAL